jgi:hypothetical protein
MDSQSTLKLLDKLYRLPEIKLVGLKELKPVSSFLRNATNFWHFHWQGQKVPPLEAEDCSA